MEIACRCISKANRLKYYYIHPSLLIKEYNKSKNEIKISRILDESTNQTTSAFSKMKHSTIFSSEKIITTSENITNEKSVNNITNEKSVYNVKIQKYSLNSI